jgi:ArsR family transcriptional regulator
MKKAAPETVESSAKLLKALADPVRLRLLNLLVGRDVCVCHLHDALGLPQPTVSRHLAYLRKAGLVSARKQGLWVYYRLTESTNELHRSLLNAVLPTVANLAELASDQKKLESLTCC